MTQKSTIAILSNPRFNKNNQLVIDMISTQFRNTWFRQPKTVNTFIDNKLWYINIVESIDEYGYDEIKLSKLFSAYCSLFQTATYAVRLLLFRDLNKVFKNLK